MASRGFGMTAPSLRPAIFLDRDGVIIHDVGYPHRPEDIRLTLTAAEAIQLVNRSGALAIVVTNQSGIARGLFTLEQVDLFHQALAVQLAQHGAYLDAIYVAPYHPDGIVQEFAIEHEDRKPGSGMIRKALREWPIDPSRSILIGDKQSDTQAAEGVGIPALLVPADRCDLAAVVRKWLASHAMDVSS
jgi:D-glycero-D-manno-heptose 1,7-bisphosphate phosphatase